MKLVAAIALAASLAFAPGCSEDTPAPKPSEHLVDLNTATESQLVALPGIGEVAAKKIIAGRPYQRKDQLVSRNIISEAMYEKFRDAVIAKQ